MTTQTSQTYQQSIELLRKLQTEKGFTATTEETDNYKRVWSRDGVIAGLAALASGDEELIATFQTTLETLREYQDETGRIASNISLDGSRVSYGTSVGRIDATLWYVIGVSQYALATERQEWAEDFRPSLEKALFYLRCLELNGRGLLYIPQGGDWADEYINHGYVLFDQILYWWALDGYARLFGEVASREKEKAGDLAELIRVNYFPARENLDHPALYHKTIFQQALETYRPPLPLAYFTNHSSNALVDVFAISLLLLSGVLSKDGRAEAIIEEVLGLCVTAEQSILPAFWPVITESDRHWPHLATNNLFGLKNKPYEYHNGGRWPLVHGWFLAALSKNRSGEAKIKLESFANQLATGGYTFPEFYHGQTMEPLGTPHLGFSAAAFVLAHQALQAGRRPLL